MLASAAVITGILALAWFAGVLVLAELVLLVLGLYAPHAVALLSAIYQVWRRQTTEPPARQPSGSY